MKSNSRFSAKIVPLAIGLIVITTCIVWGSSSSKQRERYPIFRIEKTIQSQNGELVSLKEMSNGTLYLYTSEGKFVSHFRPNSPKVEELVEKYHISYKYSNGSPAGNWIIGGVLLLLMITAFVIHKKGGIGVAKAKHSTAKSLPLPSITLNDIGGLPEEMKEEIHQTLEIIKDPDQLSENWH